VSNMFSRRRFLSGASALGATSLLGLPESASADPPPETTTLRMVHSPAICIAPQYLAEAFLRLEGFNEVQYVRMDGQAGPINLLESGDADIAMDSAPSIVYSLGRGNAVTALAGIHVGCYELFGNGRVSAIRDLRGKTVAISGFGGGNHVIVASMLAYVGIDPVKDVNWVMGGMGQGMQLFVDGKADAFMGFAPQPQRLRDLNIGKLIVDTGQDRPWSHYFCCMLAGNREFVARHPVAAKRVLRAYLKAADVCAREPDRVAHYLVDKGFEPRYDIAQKVLRSLPFDRWRHDGPEDTLRFYALRLYEVGMINTPPNELIAQGADWRFLNELKKEVKA